MISLIAAIGSHNEIGIDNHLPWHIPEDMAFFKQMTKGKTVLMGRKTYESIGHPLVDRDNLIITHDASSLLDNLKSYQNLNAYHFKVITNYQDVVKAYANNPKNELLVIGGETVYKLFLPYANQLILTLVNVKISQATSYFPNYQKQFTLKTASPWQMSSSHIEYQFTQWEKKPIV